MNTFLILGIIIATGFVAGEISAKIRLPKVTGYLLAGILLNPNVTHFIPHAFNQHTDLITNIALSFITFAVGGVLFYPKIKILGKTILSITFWEAELAFLVVALGFIFLMPLTHSLDSIVIIPFALLMGALASPTDPSATLAVKQEYHADGEVSSSIMGVAALDDITGILNYSVSVVLAMALLNHGQLSFQALFLNPLITVIVSILIGVICGLLFNGTHRFFNKETENALIIILIGALMICYGLAQYFKVEELLATMTMGIIVVNFNPMKEKIFSLLERYTDQLIFVLFFTISGMHLNFQLLWKYFPMVCLFIILRTIGKFSGAFLGATLTHASIKVKKYVGGGLIPQGGIVIGLALLVKQNPQFNGFSDILISLIIGATVIHEIIGPLLAKIMLKKAGEI